MWLSVAGVLLGYLCQFEGVSLHGALRAAWFLEAVMSVVSGWHVHTMIGQTMSTTGRCFVRQRPFLMEARHGRAPSRPLTWASSPGDDEEWTSHRDAVKAPDTGEASPKANEIYHWSKRAYMDLWATMRFTRNDTLNKRCRRLSGKRRLFAPELFAFVNKDTPCSWKYPESSSPVFWSRRCTLSGAELSIMSEVAHRPTEKISCGTPTTRILFCKKLDRLDIAWQPSLRWTRCFPRDLGQHWRQWVSQTVDGAWEAQSPNNSMTWSQW